MSLESVKSKVLEEASAKAAAKIADARTVAERILSEGKAADERTAADTLRDARLRLDRETNRELERVQHDNRLRILSAKNKAIDEVFARVGEKLAGLADSDYMDLIGSWLGGLPANVGGVLRVNPKDAAKFTAGLAALNRGRSGEGAFTGVTSDPKVPNGAVVDGPDYSIDCTVARRLNELRESSAGEVARVLFGA
jgi:vacuolar-type H+-ATPase subunit E/Vma4